MPVSLHVSISEATTAQWSMVGESAELLPEWMSRPGGFKKPPPSENGGGWSPGVRTSARQPIESVGLHGVLTRQGLRIVTVAKAIAAPAATV